MFCSLIFVIFVANRKLINLKISELRHLQFFVCFFLSFNNCLTKNFRKVKQIFAWSIGIPLKMKICDKIVIFELISPTRTHFLMDR